MIVKKIIFLCTVTLLFAHCSQTTVKETTKGTHDSATVTSEPPKTEIPSRADLQKKITDLEKELYTSQELDESKAKKMISLYELYYQNYFKDYGCADYLFKAGELA